MLNNAGRYSTCECAIERHRWRGLHIFLARDRPVVAPGIRAFHATARDRYAFLRVATPEFPLFQDPDVVLQEPTVEALEESKSPHGDKLVELVNNPKLPEVDRPRVHEALSHYEQWRTSIRMLTSTGEQRIRDLVDVVNTYKLQIEVDLIMGSPDSFLYRQNGQLKIGSSILEEFLPDLVHPLSSIFPLLSSMPGVEKGPFKAFAAVSFQGTLSAPAPGAGLAIRTKDHDFTVGRNAWLKSSFDQTFPAADSVTRRIYLAFVASECKTNLDKTMFQEAAATAHDLRVAVPGARYYLLCEWLDMTPISTAGTDIQEVIILRGKRLGSNLRRDFANAELRLAALPEIRARFTERPIRADRIIRFTEHLRAVVSGGFGWSPGKGFWRR